MKPGLSLRVSQHLALTPQLQQSIRLLQLSTLELSQEIEQMLQDNPFLEQEEAPLGDEERIALERSQRDDALLAQEERETYGDDVLLSATDSIALNADSMPEKDAFDAQNASSDADGDAPSTEPQDWEGDGSHETAPDDSEWGVEAGARQSNANSGDDAPDGTQGSAGDETLQEHLHRQALSLRLSQQDATALRVLIESLNDDGYLLDDLEEIAHSLGAHSLEEVEELLAQFAISLKLLQSLEPTGVGVRSLAECLLLQIAACEHQGRIHPEEAQAARSILAQPLELLAKRDVRKLGSLCKLTQDEIKAAIALISRLEPKPARRFAQVERNMVIPDVIVRPVIKRRQTHFVAQLNPEVVPKLHVHDLYANALGGMKGGKKSEAVQGLQTRLQEARWFIKNVQQRFDTILRVSQSIVDRQASFFKHGAVAMRPLVLREIADEIGMHESTISRVTTAKYMSTPYGTFELKYFFGSALTTETGGIASSTAVRELIKQFIDAESKAKPLSDNAICLMLKEQGIECARRTVAKYREALRIPVTSLRKTL
ncbi:MAG: RNA polymerase factor sigma-54 [Brachymonas sp.]